MGWGSALPASLLNSRGGAGADPRSGFRLGLPPLAPLTPNFLKGPVLGCSSPFRGERTLTAPLDPGSALEFWNKVPEDPRPKGSLSSDPRAPGDPGWEET